MYACAIHKAHAYMCVDVVFTESTHSQGEYNFGWCNSQPKGDASNSGINKGYFSKKTVNRHEIKIDCLKTTLKQCIG